MDAGVPSSQLCLYLLPPGLHRAPYLLCPDVPVCQVGTYVYVTNRKSAPGKQKVSQPRGFLFSNFTSGLKSYCKSLLHHWLFAGCRYSSPGIFLTPFRQKSKLAAEKSKPAQAPEAIRELLELVHSLSMFRVLRRVLSRCSHSRESST